MRHLLLTGLLVLTLGCADKGRTVVEHFSQAVEAKDWPRAERLLDKNVSNYLKQWQGGISATEQLLPRLNAAISKPVLRVESDDVIAYLTWDEKMSPALIMTAVYVGKPRRVADLTKRANGSLRLDDATYTDEEDKDWRVAPLFDGMTSMGPTIITIGDQKNAAIAEAYLRDQQTLPLLKQALFERNESATNALQTGVGARITH